VLDDDVLTGKALPELLVCYFIHCTRVCLSLSYFLTLGEEWLVREVGAYLRGVQEEVVGSINPAQVLTEKLTRYQCSQMSFGKKRKAGEEWFVTVCPPPIFFLLCFVLP
jgi:Major Vault Protein repeat domain